jgi:type IV pilus assembly protein PilA
MGRSTALQRRQLSCRCCALLIAWVSFLASTCVAQTAQPDKSSNVAGIGDLNKYPGLWPEVYRLTDRFQRDVKFPPERRHSELLPLLPPSTIAYMALPNYGDAAHQALIIFRQELKNSSDLRAWWTHGDMITIGPKIEDSIERFSQLSAYLGDEIVISGALDGRDPDLLVVAAVRKSGLKAELEKILLALSDKSKRPIRILDPHELAFVKENPLKDLVIVVRPDFVMASTNPATLKNFNARLDRGTRDFLSSPFAQRILQSYTGGVSMLGALDLQKLVLLAPNDPSFAKFQRIGFADVKYAVWEHREVNGRTVSQSELSFTGPRRGIASWLGAPARLDSLDFVSPNAIFAASFVLNNPPQLLDDIQQLSTSNPNALASLPQIEHALGISVKNDILGQLGGEVTIELDSVIPADAPVWKAILRVRDANRLQQALSTLLNAGHYPTEQQDKDGITYHSLSLPAGKTSTTVAFAFVDGYLIFASSPDTLADAIRIHQGSQSLSGSQHFQALLPPGHSDGASALLYYDPTAMAATRLQQFFGSIPASMSQIATKRGAAVLCFYGEDNAILEASTNPGMGVGALLFSAALAIPNLTRSRTATNEASAVAGLRTMNVAQVSYATAYPDHGFAPDLASLGPNPDSLDSHSPNHAGLLNSTLGNRTCTSGTWCVSSGYRFMIKATCAFGSCQDFVAVATPVMNDAGSKTFCSTSDGIIRYQIVQLLTTPLAVRECKTWRPVP